MIINRSASSKITFQRHDAFAAERLFKRFHISNFFFSFFKIKKLNQHSLRSNFEQVMIDHMKKHRTMNTFQTMNRKHAQNQQILKSMWIFIYKTNDQRFVIKCKTRLIIYENQQNADELFTKIITLTISTFRTIMIIVICFNLKTIQMNAVNVFVNCDLNEIIYMKQSSYYENMSNRRTADVQSILQNEKFMKTHFIKLCAEFD